MVSKHGETAFQRFPEYMKAKKLTKKDVFLQLRSELCDDGTGKANNGIETRKSAIDLVSSDEEHTEVVCPVCIEPIVSNRKVFTCGHQMHHLCYIGFLENKIPTL